MSLLCRLGLHAYDLAHSPMRMRCTRCGRETKGWDVGPAPVVRYTGHLTAEEVRASKRRGVTPVYVSPQVAAELARVPAPRQKRGPAIILAMREGGKR